MAGQFAVLLEVLLEVVLAVLDDHRAVTGVRQHQPEARPILVEPELAVGRGGGGGAGGIAHRMDTACRHSAQSAAHSHGTPSSRRHRVPGDEAATGN